MQYYAMTKKDQICFIALNIFTKERGKSLDWT